MSYTVSHASAGGIGVVIPPPVNLALLAAVYRDAQSSGPILQVGIGVSKEVVHGIGSPTGPSMGITVVITERTTGEGEGRDSYV